MTEPYKVTDEVVRHVVQESRESRDGAYWYETRKGTPESMKLFYDLCREDFPERVFRLVEEVTYITRTVIIEPNEPAAPKKKEKKTDDTPKPDEAGAADAEAEDEAEDGGVPDAGVPSAQEV